LARALPSPSWMKFVRAFPEAGFQAAAMNLSEGFFNLNETGRFTTSWMTTAGGAGAALGSGIGHIGAVKLGHWIKGRLGFDLPHHKPPFPDPDPALANRTPGHDPAAGHGPAAAGGGGGLPGDDGAGHGGSTPAPPYRTLPGPGENTLPAGNALPVGSVLPATGAGTPPATSWSPTGGTQLPRSGQVRLDIPERLTLGHTAPAAARPGDGRPTPFSPAPRLATESATGRPLLATGERARLEEALHRWQVPEELTRPATDDADRAGLLLERPAAAFQAMQHLRRLAGEAGLAPAEQRRLLAPADAAVARRDWPQTTTHLTAFRDHIHTTLHTNTPDAHTPDARPTPSSALTAGPGTHMPVPGPDTRATAAASGQPIRTHSRAGQEDAAAPAPG
ncbi:hypothetical protein ACFC02_42760, partial [Streptomyces sp. NPDC056160]